MKRFEIEIPFTNSELEEMKVRKEGICIRCNSVFSGVPVYATGKHCASCNTNTVYGAKEIILMVCDNTSVLQTT